MSVDFPLPLGPSSPVTHPASISAESAGSTTRPPRTTRRSRISIAATARRLRSFPMAIPVFSRAHVEAAVSPERALEAVRDAFVAYANGEWTMPPKVYVPAYPAGDFRAMPALGGGHALLKWVTSFPGNPAHGLPTVSGLVLLSDASNGLLVAVLDAGAVTALRTGAAAVLAAEALGTDGSRRRDRRGCERARRGTDVRCARAAFRLTTSTRVARARRGRARRGDRFA